MSQSPDDRLLELAEWLADGREIDWDALEQDEPALTRALDRFRQLEAIAEAHVVSDAARADAAAPSPMMSMMPAPLFEWGSIQVIEKLGEGGFAEVFRAWDPSLEREVALKLSRSDLESGAVRTQRWIEEARRLARVRHPNVLVVHGVDIRDGRAGIWTDLIRGRTLEGVLQDQGPLDEGEATLIALDLCRALAAVHAAGLVHGDLKATNVMRESGIGPASAPSAGRIVLMDFGASHESTPGGAHSTPLVTPLSCAPEVLNGETATPSSDLYSLGVLLYRLVTGRHPIEAANWTELDDKARRGDRVPLRDVRPDLRAEFLAVVDRALDPDPSRRFSSASHMEQTLRSALKEENESRTAPSRSGVAAALLIVTLIGLGAIAGLLWNHFRNKPGVRFKVQIADLQLALDPNHLAISPDGTQLAFVASDTIESSLWVRHLRDFKPRQLPGTKGARLPFWSPDGRNIGFISDGSLKRIGLDGGGMQVLCDAPHPRGASWGKRDVIVFTPSPTGPLFQINAHGGPVTPVTTLDSTAREVAHRWPSFLPDGEHFIFTSVSNIDGPFEVRIGSIHGGHGRSLLTTPSAAVYAHPGHLIYAGDTAIVAQRFDAGSARIRGAPFPVADPPQPTRTMGQGSPRLSVSSNGVLAWRAVGDPNTRLVWIDRNARRLATLNVRPRRWLLASMSPDGRRALLQEGSGKNSDLWMLDLGSEAINRLTLQQGTNQIGAWSPDGKEILYTSTRDGRGPVVLRRAVDGPGTDHVFYQSAASGKLADGWSLDGKWVVLQELSDKNGMDLLRMPSAGGPPIRFLATPFNEGGAQLSPDGKWVLYLSNEGGSGAYVQSFPNPGKRLQVSPFATIYARWVKGGREILLFCRDFWVRSVEVEPGRELRFSPAHELMEFPPDMRFLAPSPDGERLLLLEAADRGVPGISIAINWKTRP